MLFIVLSRGINYSLAAVPASNRPQCHQLSTPKTGWEPYLNCDGSDLSPAAMFHSSWGVQAGPRVFLCIANRCTDCLFQFIQVNKQTLTVTETPIVPRPLADTLPPKQGQFGARKQNWSQVFVVEVQVRFQSSFNCSWSEIGPLLCIVWYTVILSDLFIFLSPFTLPFIVSRTYSHLSTDRNMNEKQQRADNAKLCPVKSFFKIVWSYWVACSMNTATVQDYNVVLQCMSVNSRRFASSSVCSCLFACAYR